MMGKDKVKILVSKDGIEKEYDIDCLGSAIAQIAFNKDFDFKRDKRPFIPGKPKPLGPCNMIIEEGIGRFCKNCASTLYYTFKFFVFKKYSDKCIQPECKNYYKK